MIKNKSYMIIHGPCVIMYERHKIKAAVPSRAHLSDPFSVCLAQDNHYSSMIWTHHL